MADMQPALDQATNRERDLKEEIKLAKDNATWTTLTNELNQIQDELARLNQEKTANDAALTVA